MTSDPLILASTSPRRADLLRSAGIAFRVIEPGFDEGAHVPAMSGPQAVAVELALHKARSVADDVDRGIVLGCDTVIAAGDRMIGKPKDRADAERILRALIGARHDVITGVCLIDAATGAMRSFADTATVAIGPVDDRELDRYLASGAWAGKAGGYNLPEVEADWPVSVAGDRATVIGLPVDRLIAALREISPALVPTRTPHA